MIWEEWQNVYMRYFGRDVPVPDNKQSSARDAWLHWVATLSEREAILLCETVAERGGGRIGAPPLAAFIGKARAIMNSRPESQAEGGINPALREDIKSTRTPMFDFMRAGYPKRRQAFLCELPAAARVEVEKITDAGLDGKLDAEEVGRLLEVAFQPRWEDFTEDEQRAACKRWHVARPEIREA